MKKILGIFFTLFLGTWLLVIPVSAGCGGQYESPCQSYSMFIDKMVQIPGTSNYVDNLSISDPRYKPSEYVMFKVTIKNTSTTQIGEVTARDYVPAYLTPSEGPGTFEASSRIITWNAGYFAIDEQKTYYFKMQINSQVNLPTNQGLFCLVNKAQAWSNDMTDDDSSQFCIEKQVAPPPKVPSAGPEMGLLLFTGELFALGTGIFIKYKLGRNK
jgi:hypothetical protein